MFAFLSPNSLSRLPPPFPKFFTAPTLLAEWYPYTSMEPARMLAMLHDIPTSNDDQEDSSCANNSTHSCPTRAAHDKAEQASTAPFDPTAPGSECGLRQRRPTAQDDNSSASNKHQPHAHPHAHPHAQSQPHAREEEHEEQDDVHRAALHSSSSSSGCGDDENQKRQSHDDSKGQEEQEQDQGEEDDDEDDENDDGEASTKHDGDRWRGCAVCLRTRMKEPAMCSCTHTFCFDCIGQTTSCPVCRKPHFGTFVMLGSGDVVTLKQDSSSTDTARYPLLYAMCRSLLGVLWYAIVFVTLLPFVAALFALGFVWSGITELIDLIRGKETVYPVPLSYKRLPLIAPHGLATAPPPWSQPSLWGE